MRQNVFVFFNLPKLRLCSQIKETKDREPMWGFWWDDLSQVVPPAPCPPAYPNKNHTVVARCAEHPPNRLFLGRNLFHNDSWGSKEKKYKAYIILGKFGSKKGPKGILAMHTLQLRNLDWKENPYVSVPPHIVGNCVFPRAKMQNSKFWSYLGQIPMKLMFTWDGRAGEHTWTPDGDKGKPTYLAGLRLYVLVFACLCVFEVYLCGRKGQLWCTRDQNVMFATT